MRTNRYAAERGINAGRSGMSADANPFKRADRRELWERGRINGKAGGFACGAIAPHAPTLACLCGHHKDS
jgi:ribosome modulation factor